MLLNTILYILTGILAGTLSGLLGIGGGLVIVPGLVFIFEHNLSSSALVMHMAIATSLCVMVFTTQATVRAYNRRQDIKWRIFWRLLPGIICGTIMGVLLAKYLPTHYLRFIFSGFLLFIAYRMLLASPAHPAKKLPGYVGSSTVASAIGLQSSLLGIGGGSLTIPFLTRCNVDIRDSVVIASLCSLTLAVIGTLSNMFTGLYYSHHLAWDTGFIHWPAVIGVAIPSMLSVPFGVWLSHRLPVTTLKRIFGVMMILIAIDMLIKI